MAEAAVEHLRQGQGVEAQAAGVQAQLGAADRVVGVSGCKLTDEFSYGSLAQW